MNAFALLSIGATRSSVLAPTLARDSESVSAHLWPRPIQSRKQNDIEAETFGFMHGHQLNAATIATDGSGYGEEACQPLRHRFAGRVDAVRRDLLQHAKVRPRVLITGRVDAGGAAQAVPGPFDPRRERALPMAIFKSRG